MFYNLVLVFLLLLFCALLYVQNRLSFLEKLEAEADKLDDEDENLKKQLSNLRANVMSEIEEYKRLNTLNHNKKIDYVKDIIDF